jgi:monofunctional biosynthetic peptidoglycan transglycosylase
MQVYLNVIEMGDGIYGCEAASKAYFHHNAILLKASEAASIAAVLPNPRKYKVNKPGPYVKYRQQVIQRRMGKLPAIIWD